MKLQILPFLPILFFASITLAEDAPTLPQNDFRINQTSTGTFTIVKNNTAIEKYTSSWMQDDGNQRLFLNIGRPDEESFMAEFWIMQNESYETSKEGSVYKCKYIPDKGYLDEIMGYACPQSLSYMGPAKLQGYDYVTWDPDTWYQLYIGPARDLVGTMDVVAVVEYTPKPHSNDSILYRGLYTVGVPGKFDYNVYRLTEASNSVPNETVYDVPKVCRDAKKEYYAHKGGGGALRHGITTAVVVYLIGHLLVSHSMEAALCSQ